MLTTPTRAWVVVHADVAERIKFERQTARAERAGSQPYMYNLKLFSLKLFSLRNILIALIALIVIER